MPKILERDPAWLAKSTPGFEFFQPDASAKASHTSESSYQEPRRTLATRKSELFVVVGNELRWSELNLLRDAGEELQGKKGRQSRLEPAQHQGGKAYRVSYIQSNSLTVAAA